MPTSPRIVAAVSLLVVLAAGCATKGDPDAAATSDVIATTTTTATAASCVPAVGSDFVAVERHLTHGGHHLGQGFAVDTPQGRYLIADVYTIDNELIASDLVWKIGADGSAQSVTPATSGFDSLPDVPAAEATAPAGLEACAATQAAN